MENQQYHRAKQWQIAFFAMNNSATNAYMFLMTYISYYATGIAGLGVAIIGIISTAIRLWDGVTDPIVGFFIDRTNGKFGFYRQENHPVCNLRWKRIRKNRGRVAAVCTGRSHNRGQTLKWHDKAADQRLGKSIIKNR